MSNNSNQVLIDALRRGLSDPDGLPLHGTKKSPGLFGQAAFARGVAERSKQEGYLAVVRRENRGKSAREICVVTEKGVAYLLAQANPKAVLEDLVRALTARHAQVGDLVSAARQTQTTLDSLRVTAERVLQHVGKPSATAAPAPSSNGSDSWKGAALSHLAWWRESRPSEDCPLPELFRRVSPHAAELSLGHFHDGLRQLHDSQTIYLHPWTGPLYQMPEPSYALLIGHEIAYYASLRT
jgi:hypothetical protein